MVDGQTIKVKNNAGSILKIYPFSGAAINGLTATTGALSMAANTIADFTRTSSTQVYSTPLLPSYPTGGVTAARFNFGGLCRLSIFAIPFTARKSPRWKQKPDMTRLMAGGVLIRLTT